MTKSIARYFSHYSNIGFQIKRTSMPSLSNEATLTIEAADRRKNSSTNSDDSSFDWDRKISFQLKSQSELVSFALVFLGRLKSIELSNHGVNRNKSLQVIRNENMDIFISVKEEKRNISGPIPFSCGYIILALAVIQLRHNLSMTQEEALQLLRLIPIPTD